MSLKRSLAWMGAAQGIGFVFQFGSSIVVARYLTPHETGTFVVATATVGLFSLMQALGLQALIVREEHLTREITATAFTINALIAVVLASVIFLCGSTQAVVHDQGVRQVLRVLALVPIVNAAAFLPSAQMERGGRFRSLALISTTANVCGAVVSIVLSIAGYSFMSIAYGQVTSSLATTVVTIAAGREHNQFRFSLAAWHRIGAFGFQMMAISGLNAFSLRLSDVLMGRLLGLSELGIYGRATNINGLLWNNLNLVIGRVLLVDFAKAHRSGGTLRSRYLQSLGLITGLLWPAFAGVAVLSYPLIDTLYGAKWVQSAVPLTLLALASAIQVLVAMSWEVFASKGEMGLQTRIEFFRTVFALCTFALGCLYGIEAAAGARVLDSFFAVFGYMSHLNRMTDTKLSDLLPIYGKSAAVTVLAIAPASLAVIAFAGYSHFPVLLMAPVIASGCVLWFAGLRMVSHPLAPEVVRLVNSLNPVSSP